MNLSTKQYYSRIAGLVDVGLIKRNNGKYFSYTNGKGSLSITNVNRQDTFLLVKVKAIESVETSSNVEIPKEELTQLINALIDNHLIKDILIKEPMSYTFEDHQLDQHQQSKETKLIAN